MLKKIKNYILVAVAAVVLSLSLSTALVSAQSAEIQDSTCQGAANLSFEDSGTCSNSLGNPDAEVDSLITTVINTFSIVVGIVSVIMIIYGGFRYITSGGDSGKVTSARNTILYAIIGLIIVALSQFIVKFVLAEATG